MRPTPNTFLPLLFFPLASLALPTISFNSLIHYLTPRQYGSDTSGTWLPANYASGSSSGCSHYGANGECGGATLDTNPADFNDPATLLGLPDDHTATALPPAGGTTSLDSFLSEAAAAATATASSDDAEETSATEESDSTTTESSQVARATSASVTAVASTPTRVATATSTGAAASETASAASEQNNGANGRATCSSLGALAFGGTILMLLL